jgi:hypothetical protein
MVGSFLVLENSEVDKLHWSISHTKYQRKHKI